MHYTHLEVAGYICAALFMIYSPPRVLAGVGPFIEAHFGDAVGFYILHLGIILVVIGGVYPMVGGIAQTGNSLILAGMVALKLTKTNGGSASTTSETTVISKTVVEPKPPDQPAALPRVSDVQHAAAQALKGGR